MQVKCLLSVLLLDVVCVMPASIPAEESAIERTVLFEEETDGFRLYRIPGIVVTASTVMEPAVSKSTAFSYRAANWL